MTSPSVPEGGGAPAVTAGRLHRRLGSFGLTLLALSCLSPVLSVYGVGSDVLQHVGTGAAGLFILGIGAAVIWSLVYAELGSAYPYAGGDYVGVGTILGGWAGVATLAIIAVTAGPSTAFEAKIIATYAADLAPSVSPDLITFTALGVAVAVALLAVRLGAVVTGIFLAVEMLAVLGLLAAGFAHPQRGLGEALLHPVTLGSNGLLAPAAFAALALGGVSAVYGTVGGNQAIYFGEELEDPHRRMGRVILIAGLIGAFATALPVIGVALSAQNLAKVLRSPAPISAFVAETQGAIAAKILSAGVALAIFNALIAQVMAYARIYYSLGRDNLFTPLINRVLSQVHASSGAPRNATLILGAFSAAACFLSSHVLLVFITGTTVYGWGLVCLAVLNGRRRGLTGAPGYWRAPLYPLAPLAGLAMAAVFALADLTDPEAGLPSLLILGVVVVAALVFSRFVLSRRPGGWIPHLAKLET